MNDSYRSLACFTAATFLVGTLAGCPDTTLGANTTASGGSSTGGTPSTGSGAGATSSSGDTGGAGGASGGGGHASGHGGHASENGGGGADPCNDHVLSPGETDVDCGGSVCPPCADTKKCKSGDDCESTVCVDGKCETPASCAASGKGQTNCGDGGTGTESCCTSLRVTGGTFKRSYDGISFLDDSHPATVSDFRLDKYEVTVGRFRQFVAAWDGGWRPSEGDGKHAYLNGGSGLEQAGSSPTSYEPGWDTSSATGIATDKTAWTTALSCNPTWETWTQTSGSTENRPINCVSWAESLAFCIWDGGFLPSEAEWNYAAAAGDEQRYYPWSPAYPPGSSSINCSFANTFRPNNSDYCVQPGVGSTSNVGSLPKGKGKFGQADLAGNVWELTLDWYADPYLPCSDCANFNDASTVRSMRGGSFADKTARAAAANRDYIDPGMRAGDVGFRCARSP